MIAVLRASTAESYGPVARVLAEMGIQIELTLTTPGTIATLAELRQMLPPEAVVGIGTILTTVDARAALDAGAQFLVTPNASPGVIKLGLRRDREVYAGAFTPTEAQLNWSHGATAVKLFPASVVGADFIRHLHGPFPEMRVVPSGGVSLDNIGDWILAGAVAVSLGGPLVGDSLTGGSLRHLAARADAAVSAVAAARAAR